MLVNNILPNGSKIDKFHTVSDIGREFFGRTTHELLAVKPQKL